MADTVDYNAIASLVSLSDAYISHLPEKPCAVAAPVEQAPAATQATPADQAPTASQAAPADQAPGAVQAASTEQSSTASQTASAVQAPPASQEAPADQAGGARPPLEAIAAKIASCTRCGLCNGRTNTVPGMGPAHPVVMVIGEGPGHDEDMQGLPFVGAAGQLLDKMLGAIKLSRDTNCFIANIVKCRPPNNRDPLPEEAAACRSFLDAQISALKPKMILLVGRIALQNLLDTKIGITRIHGQFFEYNGIPVMPTYHPSALLRTPDLKRDAWNDLKAFRAKLEEITGESFTVDAGGN